MKVLTDWWGVTLGAETEQDLKLLKVLVAGLPEKAENYYENGKIRFVMGPHESRDEGKTFGVEVLSYLEFNR